MSLQSFGVTDAPDEIPIKKIGINTKPKVKYMNKSLFLKWNKPSI